jgi:hypothetical protein
MLLFAPLGGLLVCPECVPAMHALRWIATIALCAVFTAALLAFALGVCCDSAAAFQNVVRLCVCRVPER